jgi:hypothetical protein
MLNQNLNSAQSLFVVLNEQKQIVYSSFDALFVPLMQKHVRRANDAGDAWTLIEYKAVRVISCDGDGVQTT